MANKKRYAIDGQEVEFRDPFTGDWYPVLESRKGLPYVSGGGFQLFFRQRVAIEGLERAARKGAREVRFKEGEH